MYEAFSDILYICHYFSFFPVFLPVKFSIILITGILVCGIQAGTNLSPFLVLYMYVQYLCVYNVLYPQHTWVSCVGVIAWGGKYFHTCAYVGTRTYSMPYKALWLPMQHSIQLLLAPSLSLPLPLPPLDQWEQCVRHACSASGEDAEQPCREGPYIVYCATRPCPAQWPGEEEGTHHLAEWAQQGQGWVCGRGGMWCVS